MTPQSDSDPPGSEVRTPPSNLRSFWCLFVTQFQGAFSDNVFKFLTIFLVSDLLTTTERDQYITAVLAVFSLPFILFSMTGGFLADRFSKRSVVIGTKMAEVGVMVLGTFALVTQNLPFLVGVIFLMSTQSAFFGPSKYGLLPELLSESRLSWGNGFLGLGTFLAIISGGVLAGVLYESLGERQLWSGLLLVVLACLGLAASTGIVRLPPADPQRKFAWNLLGDLWANLKTIGTDRVLTLAIVGSVYFWFLGALFGEPTIFIYSTDVLQLGETQIAMLRACLAVGIALGSGAAGFLSGRKIEYGLVPLGALGLTVCAGLLAVRGLTALQVAVLLGLLGFSGGFYIVPINALIQHRPDPRRKGSVIATNAWLTSLSIFLASGVFWMLRTALKLEPAAIFLLGAAATLVGTLFALKQMPDAVLRLVLWMLTRTVYRLRVFGRDHIPARGGALFVCNHLSFVDALLLQASIDRPIRFVMFKDIYERPLIRPWARTTGAIPISSEQRPREMLQSLRAASDAIRAGDVVCIFAEGQITRIGQLLPFRRGFERIMQDVDAPIVPVALDGVWGSVFSFEKRRFFWKLPHRIPYPVTVNYGRAMPHTASPPEVRQAVQELMAQAWRARKARMRPLHREFVRTARRYPLRFAMADGQNAKVSLGSALMRTILLARRLRHVWAGQKMVGLLLPPSAGGALTNWAALLCGKVPVNLNYTLSAETLAACIRQCEIKTVLTSRAFLEKVKLAVPGEVIFLEELLGRARNTSGPQGAASPASGQEAAPATAPPETQPSRTGSAPTLGEKVAAFLMAWFVPIDWVERTLGREQKARLDDLATVIFSSGSTGEPKGVMLSHYNVGSNVEQMAQVFDFYPTDRMLGILPFFHSFGFTATLCLPGTQGLGVVFHPNPLDAKVIGQLVSQYAVTFLLGTPTFFQIYLRGCAPGDFGSLRIVVAGAEKLPQRLAAAFEERFGVRPLEGYGCTECSPVVAVNRADFRSAGFRQVGAKVGTVGLPLPGECVRIVDPATLEPLSVGQAGLLLVRGPNVMRGYLHQPEKTADVLRDGWYVTGDIAAQDEDGFLRITDRLSRFSKIGGEMVPHIKVEEKLHELTEATEHCFVVTSASDEKKGERLLVLHKLGEANLKACLEKLAQCDLPNLWKPRPDAFFHVDAFPVLGSGKLDLRKVKEVAMERSRATPAES